MHRIASFRRIPAQQLSQLEERMQAYYAAVPDYPAFHAPPITPWSGAMFWAKCAAAASERGGAWPFWNLALAAPDCPPGYGSNSAPMTAFRSPSSART
jgi:hypothetical protein